MKRLIAILFLFATWPALAATYYKATLTVTSVPPVGATLSASGDTRTFTNDTAVVAGKWIQTTNTLQATATNVWAHANLYTFTNVNAVRLGTNDTAVPTNTVVFEMVADRFVTFTALSNWCSITYSTNVIPTGWIGVRVWATNEPLTIQTQVNLGLVQWLNLNKSTNVVLSNAAIFTNFLNNTRVGAQNITNLNTFDGTNRPVDFLGTNGGLSGPATWLNRSVVTNLTGMITNAHITGGVHSNSIVTNAVRVNAGGVIATNAFTYSGIISNTTISNSPWINGILGGLTNGQIHGARISNAVLHATNGYLSNFVAHSMIVTNLDAPGTGLRSTVIGLASDASGDDAIAFGYIAEADGEGAVAIGANAIGTGPYSVAVGNAAETTADNGVALGHSAVAGNSAVALGSFSVASGTSSVAIGDGVSTATANEIVIGRDFNFVTVPGEIRNTRYTNSVTRGTNSVNARVDFVARTVSSLANGNNSGVVLGSNVYVRLSGPSGAYTNAGFLAAVDGTYHILQFDNPALNMTILNDSGLDATAANRIYTSTGGNLNFTNNPVILPVIYDGSVSRWRLAVGMPYR